MRRKAENERVKRVFEIKKSEFSLFFILTQFLEHFSASMARTSINA